MILLRGPSQRWVGGNGEEEPEEISNSAPTSSTATKDLLTRARSGGLRETSKGRGRASCESGEAMQAFVAATAEVCASPHQRNV